MPTPDALSRLSDAQLAECDIALVNLACAMGLPGDSIDVEDAVDTIDHWALRVHAEVVSQRFLFDRAPYQYNNSWAYFQVLVMITVLQQDLGVKYNSDRINDPDFSRHEDLFVHGIVQGSGGTCASLPVLYAAIGRRLGWPIKLALAKTHVFCRWDDPASGERFNIEGSGLGLVSDPDSHYRSWPIPISAEELSRREFLVSLTPREELAVFLAARGHCLMAHGAPVDALYWYEKCVELMPTAMAYQIQVIEARRAHETQLEASLSRVRRHQQRPDALIRRLGLP